jgi:rRNA maturation RNase YbeY
VKIVPSSRSRVKGKGEFERAAPLMEAVASCFPPEDALVEVNLVGERRMAELSRLYRSKGGASEILTFSYTEDPPADPSAENPVGEIYLCWRRIAVGAGKRSVSRRAYLLRLLVHGLCHLRGYRHDDTRSEKRMENVEKRILRQHLSEEEVARLFE